jgi:hypothetical protein
VGCISLVHTFCTITLWTTACVARRPSADFSQFLPVAGILHDNAVGIVSRFMHNPDRPHWNVVKHIFRYLIGTQEYNIKFGANEPSGPVGFTDLDYAGCLNTRKSTYGYFFIFGTGVVVFGLYSSKCMCASGTIGVLNQEMDNLRRD